MDEFTYNHRHHSKGPLKVHLIFVTKYRRKCLTGNLNDTVKAVLRASAVKHGWKITNIETDQDHVHILLEYTPVDTISLIVKTLKQESTYFCWQLHTAELSKLYWKKRILWNAGFFYCSIGQASEKTIQDYINNQG